jgi:hypothetical protein
MSTSSQINALVIIVAKGHRTLGTLSLSRLDLGLHAFAAKDVIAFRNDSVLRKEKQMRMSRRDEGSAGAVTADEE